MNLKYNKEFDEMYVGEKKLTKKNRAYKKYVMHYIFTRIAEGGTLDMILPSKSKVLPSLQDFVDWAEAEEYQEVYKKARRARYTLTCERLLSVAEMYRRKPTAGNAELLKATTKALDYLEKGGIDNDAITLQFNSILPQDYWEKR